MKYSLFLQRRVAAVLFLAVSLAGPAVLSQEQKPEAVKKEEKKLPEPRAKDGKKLLTALDAMKVAGVGGPRLSPDGTRVAYTVSETKMEKDKEWKSVTQVWVAPVSGVPGKARQFTRGERSSTQPEWSSDGKQIAFLSDREKEGERQVWMMAADGGEAWQVTTHRGGVSGFRISPDGQKLLLSATDQLSKEDEDKRKVKDDT
ncbi:MAG TPA: hypothetical protein VIC04_09260, partial [Terriglobia bacterium]